MHSSKEDLPLQHSQLHTVNMSEYKYYKAEPGRKAQIFFFF